MLKKTASALGAALLLSLSLVAVADAAVAAPPPARCQPGGQGQPPYPPGLCKKPSVSNGDAQPGESQTVTSGDGQFTGGSGVIGTLVNCATNAKVLDLGSTTASSLGGASFTFTVPSVPTGQYCVQFRGKLNGANRGVSTAFAITQGSGSLSGGGNNLPTTGSNVLELTGTGAGLVLVGGGIVVLARRRRSALAA